MHKLRADDNIQHTVSIYMYLYTADLIILLQHLSVFSMSGHFLVLRCKPNKYVCSAQILYTTLMKQNFLYIIQTKVIGKTRSCFRVLLK